MCARRSAFQCSTPVPLDELSQDGLAPIWAFGHDNYDWRKPSHRVFGRAAAGAIYKRMNRDRLLRGFGFAWPDDTADASTLRTFLGPPKLTNARSIQALLVVKLPSCIPILLACRCRAGKMFSDQDRHGHRWRRNGFRRATATSGAEGQVTDLATAALLSKERHQNRE